jgi:hypothetical protein
MHRRFFGQYLLKQGYITAPQLLAAVEYQTKYNTRLGELAVALGMITPFESAQINAVQVCEDRLFGETAVQCGLLTHDQLSDALETQRNARVLLGQAIETLGYLRRSTIDSAHGDFVQAEQLAAEQCGLPNELRNLPCVAPIFERAGKLLQRVWGLPNKPGRLQIETTRLTLSDKNARARIRSRVLSGVLLGVPNEVARKVSHSYASEMHSGDAAEDHAVQDFARVLAEAALSVLHAQGESAQLLAVDLASVRATLPPEERVVMVRFLTHSGQILVGLTI